MGAAENLESHDVFWIFTATQKELDRIAIHHNSVVGRLIHHPTVERFDTTNLRRADWGFQWVATQARSNHGVLVLKPTGRRTKQLSVVGRAKHLMDQFGVDDLTAAELIRSSYGIRHTANDDVLGLVVNSLDMALWEGFEEGPLDWVKARLDSTEHAFDLMRGMNLDKIESAHAMVRAYHLLQLGQIERPNFPHNVLSDALFGKYD